MIVARTSIRPLAGLVAALFVCLGMPARAQQTYSQLAGQGTSEPVEPGEPLTPEQVLAVPAWLEALVRDRVIEPNTSREKRIENLIELMFGPEGLALAYDSGTTRTITESATDHKANCLSFSLMFVTLARRAGIDAYVQESSNVLAWQSENALYGTGHVNVGVKVNAERKTIDIDRSVVGVRGTVRAISERRVLAHYYNNRGAELMDRNQLPAARRQLDMAISMDASFVPAWNNLGVLRMREGSPQDAERAYTAALELDHRFAPALSNMINLYRGTGDTRRRAEYEESLFEVQRRDPFHQIMLALGYEKKGDYAAAAEHFQRAIRLKARYDFVYHGLARAYAHLGQASRAAEALVHARDAAGDRRDMYQTKLDRLRHVRDVRER